MAMVQVLTIETRHDSLVSVHRSVITAQKELVEFVDQFWADEMNGATRPETDTEAVEQYFEEMLGTESYSIFEAAFPEL